MSCTFLSLRWMSQYSAHAIAMLNPDLILTKGQLLHCNYSLTPYSTGITTSHFQNLKMTVVLKLPNMQLIIIIIFIISHNSNCYCCKLYYPAVNPNYAEMLYYDCIQYNKMELNVWAWQKITCRIRSSKSYSKSVYSKTTKNMWLLKTIL